MKTYSKNNVSFLEYVRKRTLNEINDGKITWHVEDDPISTPLALNLLLNKCIRNLKLFMTCFSPLVEPFQYRDIRVAHCFPGLILYV